MNSIKTRQLLFLLQENQLNFKLVKVRGKNIQR
jgi:hypothetical protein